MLQAQAEQQHPSRIEGQGDAVAGLAHRQGQHTQNGLGHDESDVDGLHISGNASQAQQGHAMNHAPHPFRKERKKEVQKGAQIQSAKDLITEAAFLVLSVLLGNGQQFLAGKECVYSHAIEPGNGLEGIDIGVSPARLP